MPFKSSPLYVQIAEGLQERINASAFKAGDKLPSERRLSETLSVNRLTIRRAFGFLESKGVIERQHGGGTFVALPKLERQVAELVPFTLAMRQQGFTPGDKVIHFEKQAASKAVAANLNIAVSDIIYSIYRVRLINGEAVMLERFFVSAKRLPNVEKHDHTARSGYEIMATEYGVLVKRAEQSLEPVIADDHEANLLGITKGSPLMLERRLSFDVAGQPVEFGRDFYRGDKFRFTTRAAPLLLSFTNK